MANIKVYHQLTVRDANGKIVKRTRKRLSRSFVLQFLQIIEVCTLESAVSIKDTGNVSRSVSMHANNLNAAGAAGEGDNGIVVGTGTGAESNTDIALGTIIAHGAGSGQLNYGIQSKTAAAVVGANVDYIMTRTFTNASGASITVQEVGIYANTTSTNYKTCILRDLTGAVAVGNGQTLTVDITLRTTV